MDWLVGSVLLLGGVLLGIVLTVLAQWVSVWLEGRDLPFTFECPTPECGFEISADDPAVIIRAIQAHEGAEHEV